MRLTLAACLATWEVRKRGASAMHTRLTPAATAALDAMQACRRHALSLQQLDCDCGDIAAGRLEVALQTCGTVQLQPSMTDAEDSC